MNGRNDKGQFVAGNSYGSAPKMVKARHNLALFRACIDADTIQEIVSVLVTKAKQGDLGAISTILKYCLPAPVYIENAEKIIIREQTEEETRQQATVAIQRDFYP